MGRNYQLTKKIEERNLAARQAEEEGNLDKAIKLYEQNIQEDIPDELAFDRLMVIYRKQKEYSKEAAVIDRGIELFKQHMNEHLQHSLGKRIDEKTLKQLSNAIIKKTRLQHEESNYPDPVNRWIKRKMTLEQKLKKETLH